MRSSPILSLELRAGFCWRQLALYNLLRYQMNENDSVPLTGNLSE